MQIQYKRLVRVCCLIFCLLIFTGLASAQFSSRILVDDNLGGKSQGGQYSSEQCLGQVVIGKIDGGNLTNYAGFMYFTFSEPVPEMIVDVEYVSGSPIQAGGGILYYSIWGENQGTVPLDYDIWIDKIYEPGPSADTTTLILREITNYQPGWQINRPDVWYPVPGGPGGWPGGNYDFRIYSGWHPEYDIWHTDAFSWVKDGPVDFDYDFDANLPTCSFPDPFDQIGLTEVEYAIPDDYEAMGAYPNPFNPVTTICFGLPVDGLVRLSIYNIKGQRVTDLVDGYRNAGYHEVTWDASNLASGMYFYRISAGEFNALHKMVLVK
ncbi:hypothetical protein CEE37_09035 [candidate division LCP-89 bacterium B3_LCP]|uniref:Secretion system C-terminal sorting domain-containing protein n=1 Tax=candidate division LCP-89 bacterium B3_LCP TaxID=2012998 RepID=A0A532UZU7_UNCL8|nr:MAG: hypothetical protein CEE37_09035 [candidate division LCP-89 bacterium B3_LCP]